MMKEQDSLEFFQKQEDLLELEHEEEIEEAEKLLSFPPRTLEMMGLCIQRLALSNIRSGFFGHCVIEFTCTEKTNMLNHNFSPGDIVGVMRQSGGIIKVSGGSREDLPDGVLLSGILSSVTNKEIALSLKPDTIELTTLQDQPFHQHYRLVKLGSEVTHKRLKQGLFNMKKFVTEKDIFLVNLFFGHCSPLAPNRIPELKEINTNLDCSQKDAVHFALSQRHLAIVHGPPGTGKTTTLVEIIRQTVTMWPTNKLLICAPSNVAVDNLLERLVQPFLSMNSNTANGQMQSLKVVRLGHPARAIGHLQRYSLDAMISRCDSQAMVQSVRKELDSLWSNKNNKRKVHCDDENSEPKMNRFQKATRRRELRQELRRRETAAVKEVIDSCQIVLSTLTGLKPKKSPLDGYEFDVVVIDECSQAIEAACWLAIPRGKKIILAGDHQQLPPTVKCQKAADSGLAVSVMERLLSIHSHEEISRTLNIQYRMNDQIMRWSSDTFYFSQLVAADCVASHTLRPLCKNIAEENDDEDVLANLNSPVIFIDTVGCGMQEITSDTRQSIGNLGEAALVFIHIAGLIACGLEGKDIGVITPYSRQVELIRRQLHVAMDSLTSGKLSSSPATMDDNSSLNDGIMMNLSISVWTYLKSVISIGKKNENEETLFDKKYLQNQLLKIEVHTVDGFQGREKEAIVMSLVRSNPQGESGFLSEMRRLNVALTRARRQLCVIGDSQTISRSSSQLESLMDYLQEKSDYRSVHEYISRFEILNETTSGTSYSAPVKSSTGNNKETKLKKNKQNKVKDKNVKKNIELSPDEIEKQKMELKQKLLKYVELDDKKNGKLLTFPSSLSARERAWVHELCEQMELQHVSKGEGDQRQICVSKSIKIKDENEVQSVEQTSNIVEEESVTKNESKQEVVSGNESSSQSQLESVLIDSTDNKEDDCLSISNVDYTINDISSESTVNVVDNDSVKPDVKVEPINSDQTIRDAIRETRERRMKFINQPPQCSANQKKGSGSNAGGSGGGGGGKKNTLSSKKSKSSSTASSASSSSAIVHNALRDIDPNDIDSLISALDKVDGICAASTMHGCHVKVRTQGYQCNHCQRRFCMTHYTPESHGCGLYAHKAARKEVAQSGLPFTRAMQPHTTYVNATKHAQFTHKLHRTIAEKEAERQRKKKS